ncbi:MAG: hypothetical protein AB7D57_06930 [Desulfovibrionaceae bacterium]
MSEWNIVESYAAEELADQDLAPGDLKRRWTEVAEDMALIPENNIRVVEQAGVVRVEVSEELYDCMRGV